MYTNIERNEMVVTTDMEDGEVVCLDVSTGEYFGLKELGLEIWNMISEFNDENEVVSALMEQYDATEDQIREDVRSFLSDLRQSGLITCDEN